MPNPSAQRASLFGTARRQGAQDAGRSPALTTAGALAAAPAGVAIGRLRPLTAVRLPGFHAS